MTAADTSAEHIQLTRGVQAGGALWSPVAAANPDAAALLELEAQVLLERHVVSIWMGCCQMQDGHSIHVCFLSKPAASGDGALF